MEHPVPSGWEPLTLQSEYTAALGTVYLRRDPLGLGFVATRDQRNQNDVVHGGALATLADIGLFIIAANGDDKMTGATLSLNLTYLRPAPLGRFIHCTGRIVREGKSIIFVDGSIWDGDDELMTFAGTIKRFRPRPS